MAKILIVDDDRDHLKMVSAFLTRENHVVETADCGARAKDLLTVSEYDVLVFDWKLPDIDGTELIKWYRSRGSAPVLMLTGKGTIDDRAEGLDSGADDYLIKPFSTKELSARLRALLRRPAKMLGNQLTAGSYTLDPGNLTVIKPGEEVRLPPREFALLEFLARHPNEIFSGEALMARVWRAESEATTDSLRTAVKNIRKKLDERIIETVPGAGYKLGC